MVLPCDGTEGISLPDRMVLDLSSSLPLGFGLLCGFFLFPGIPFDDIYLFLLIFRDIVAAGVQILLLQDEQPVPQHARLEIYQPLRVESISLVSGLEMKVRSGRAACGFLS